MGTMVNDLVWFKYRLFTARRRVVSGGGLIGFQNHLFMPKMKLFSRGEWFDLRLKLFS